MRLLNAAQPITKDDNTMAEHFRDFLRLLRQDIDDMGNVNITGPLTAFGELSVAENTPQVQMKFPYGINTAVGQVLTNHASSTVTATGGVASVTCAGGDNQAFSQIRTLDRIRYGPGQGARFEGTCAFSAGVALSSQVFGVGDDDEGFFFGYNGTAFGILHREQGELEVQSLEITGAAGGGGGDFTITLDGDDVTVTVGASATISEICAAIVAKSGDFFNAGRGWEVFTDDNHSVTFVSLVAEAAAGAFTFADVSSSVTADPFVETVTGVAPTETWIAQTAWNGDRMDGTGASGITLATSGSGAKFIDVTKLNVYKIQYQYLGAGSVNFSIEQPDGAFVKVHTIKRTGTSETPTLANPTLHLTLIAKTESLYAGSALTMKTASMAGFIEGKESDLTVRFSANNTKSTTTTTPVNILTVQNKRIFGGTINKVDILPTFLSLASESNKTVIITVYQNPTEVGGVPNYTSVNANSTVEYDTAGTTIVGGTEPLIFTLEGAESRDIDLTALNMHIHPGDKWVIAAVLSSTGTNGLVTAALSWEEKI